MIKRQLLLSCPFDGAGEFFADHGPMLPMNERGIGNAEGHASAQDHAVSHRAASLRPGAALFLFEPLRIGIFIHEPQRIGFFGIEFASNRIFTISARWVRLDGLKNGGQKSPAGGLALTRVFAGYLRGR